MNPKLIKTIFAITVFAIGTVFYASAEDLFIHFSATATVAGKQFTTPSVTSKLGQQATVGYPLSGNYKSDQGELLLTSQAAIENDTLNYKISISIPTEHAKTTALSSSGTIDSNTPIVFEFQNAGKPYKVSVLLAIVDSNGRKK